MKKYLTKITKLIIMLLFGWLLPFFAFAQITATESFEDEPPIPASSPFKKTFAQSGIKFNLSGRLRVYGQPGGNLGANASAIFMDSGDGPSSPTIIGNIGSISIDATNNPSTAFKVNSFAAYLGNTWDGNSNVGGAITFIGTKVDNSTVSATVAIPANPNVQNGLTFAGTPLNGIFLTSIAISLPSGVQYIELDDFNFTTQAVVTNQFSINDVSQLEGNSGTSNFSFTVTRSNNTAASSVQVQSSNGSAISGSDYVAFPLTTINFTAGGALTQTLNVIVNGDVTIETDETFTMTLSNPTGGVILDATGIGTILDDDASIETFETEVNFATTFSEALVNFQSSGKFKINTAIGLGASNSNKYLASTSPFATGNQGAITVVSSGKSINMLSVDLWSANVVGSTYTPTTASITFIGTKADGTGTVTHTATITPTNPSGTGHIRVSFAGTPFANVPILSIAFSISAAANYLQVDNFTFVPQTISNTQVSIDDVSILEGTIGGNNSALFTVTRTNNTTAFTVDVATSNGTAAAVSDYTAVNTTLNFTSGGALSQTVSIPIIKDATVESNETFNVTLSNATNGTLYLKQAGLGTINNDDAGIVETYEDEITNATSFSQNSIIFSATGGYKVIGAIGGTSGSGSSAFFLSSVNNAIGNMGTINITSPNIAFTIKSLDAWVGTALNTFSSGTVTFSGTVFGGGTVTTTKTITATNNTGTGWQQNITFTGTPLDNVLLTSLQVITGGALKYCDIDNLNYSIAYTSPFIAVNDALNIAIANGNVTSIANNTDFGSTCVAGGSVSKTYTIKNIGLSNLTLSGAPFAVLGGTDASQFSVTLQPTSPVAAAGSATFTLVFNPTTAGTKNASITLTNNDASNSPYVINVTGIGNADPTITLGTVPSICTGATSFTIPYTATTATPTTYSIAGTVFATVTDAALPATPITVVLTAPSVFGTNPTYNLTVKNANGCISAIASGTITVNASSLPSSAQVVTQSVINNSISASGCAILVNVLPNGVAPVSGNLTAKVWVETTQPVQFVKRHYEINPATNAVNATAKVTLYFSDAEFNSFNTQTTPPALFLPISTDAPATITARKANLKIEKRAGTGDANGTLNSYLGAVTTIDPADADIIWNATANRWEVGFNVVGFSGFWLKTQTGVLPLNLISFTGTKTSNGNLLQWKTAEEINTQRFEVERQNAVGNGQWSLISSQTAVGNGNNNYSFIDADKLSGIIFYRLKIIDNDGRFTYSNIIKLSNKPINQSTIYPNPITTTSTLEIRDRILLNTAANIIDANGRIVKIINVKNNFEIVNMSGLPSGLYMLKLANGETLKLIKK